MTDVIHSSGIKWAVGLRWNILSRGNNSEIDILRKNQANSDFAVKVQRSLKTDSGDDFNELSCIGFVPQKTENKQRFSRAISLGALIIDQGDGAYVIKFTNEKYVAIIVSNQQVVPTTDAEFKSKGDADNFIKKTSELLRLVLDRKNLDIADLANIIKEASKRKLKRYQVLPIGKKLKNILMLASSVITLALILLMFLLGSGEDEVTEEEIKAERVRLALIQKRKLEKEREQFVNEIKSRSEGVVPNILVAKVMEMLDGHPYKAESWHFQLAECSFLADSDNLKCTLRFENKNYSFPSSISNWYGPFKITNQGKPLSFKGRPLYRLITGEITNQTGELVLVNGGAVILSKNDDGYIGKVQSNNTEIPILDDGLPAKYIDMNFPLANFDQDGGGLNVDHYSDIPVWRYELEDIPTQLQMKDRFTTTTQLLARYGISFTSSKGQPLEKTPRGALAKEYPNIHVGEWSLSGKVTWSKELSELLTNSGLLSRQITIDTKNLRMEGVYVYKF